MTIAHASYPEWLPDPQQYAVEQERYRHEQALFHFGEYAYFVLLWDVDDLNEGRVERCGRCYLSRGKIAEVYGQSADSLCSECLATTFEGGYKAIIVRPAIFDYNVPAESQEARGEIERNAATVTTTHDFRMRTGDVIVRGDGTRWRVGAMNTDTLRTGFEFSDPTNQQLAMNVGTATKEDPSSVFVRKLVLDIPAIRQSHTREPVDFSAVEVIRGPIT